MVESDIAAETADVVGIDPTEFDERVEADAAVIREELDAGTFDNSQGSIGLEYEFYAVSDQGSTARTSEGAGADDYGALMRVPRGLLSLIGFEKELGLHNAEMQTTPQPLNVHGITAQEAEVRARLTAALERMRSEGLGLVSDGMWTIPPIGESAEGYLTDSVEDNGVRIATNMSDAARYHAMANTDTPAGMRIEAPHVTLQADTVMPESLITSIQPHYQVPHADDLPEYFRYAVRVAAPLLALGVNTPFFPPDLYDDADPGEIVEDAWMEHRISVFETTLNAEGIRKVRFPRDIETTEEAIERVVEDTTFVPVPVERGDRFGDRFAHFRMKHGTYWRWVRPVFGGETRSKAHARIEFRPVSGQPTIRDTIAFQAAFAGLIEGMHAREHDVRHLDWHDARVNFYAAMREGLDADLRWVTANGDPTGETDRIYEDLLETAEEGLRSRGLSDEQIGRYLGPLRERVRRRMTPARWKHRRVRSRLNEGASFEDAVYGMQRAYIRNQAETLIDGEFADWPSA